MRVPVRGESSVRFRPWTVDRGLDASDGYQGGLCVTQNIYRSTWVSRKLLACSTKLATVRRMMALQVPFQ